jgi:hypothetical protein
MIENPYIVAEDIDAFIEDAKISKGWASHIREVVGELCSFIEYGGEEEPDLYVYVATLRYDSGIKIDLPMLIRDFAIGKQDEHGDDSGLRALNYLKGIISEIEKDFVD